MTPQDTLILCICAGLALMFTADIAGRGRRR